MRIGRVRTEEGLVLVADEDGDLIPFHRGVELGALMDAADPRRLLERDALTAGAGTAVTFTAPYRPPKIIGVGLNYRETVRSMGVAEPVVPYLFPKLSSCVVGTGEPVEVDDRLTRRVDWEGELGVVIGRRVRRVSRENALDVVFGYTAANDISARDLQATDGQWLRGKSLDGFCPLGPVIVTADAIGDPQDLRIRTRVNGAVMQDGTTADMIFDVAELVSYCSASFTLEPGDLILTGTPSGCGEWMTPPRHLSPGDVVEVEVESVGSVVSPIVAPRR